MFTWAKESRSFIRAYWGGSDLLGGLPWWQEEKTVPGFLPLFCLKRRRPSPFAKIENENS